MERKKWTREEKLKILKEAEENGIELTIRNHGIYLSTFYNWRKKYRIEGEEALKRSVRVTKDENYVKRIEDELCLAKQLLADREMQIALQDELIKKKYPWANQRK